MDFQSVASGKEMGQVAWSAVLKLLGAAQVLFVLGVGGELLNK